MNTACSHCGKHFHVDDRALGKRAKCKSCGQVFVVRPEAMDEVELHEAAPPPAMGSTAQMRPVRADIDIQSADDPDDPLAALASAADSSIHDHTDDVQEHARAHGSYLTRREHGEHGKPAPGAAPAMVMGIVALALSVIGSIALGVVALMGKATVGLVAGLSTPGGIGGLIAVFAIVQGNSARRRIRRSRGVLEGRTQATVGMFLGWGALALLALVAVIGLVLLIRHGPIVSSTEKVVE